MSKNSSSTRLNITDLPRDPQRSLGGLRQALVASANYCKRYPKKLELLLKVLKATYKYCLEAQKAADKAAKAAKKVAEEEAAKKAAEEEAAKKVAEEEAAMLALAEKQAAEKSAESK